MKKYELTEKSIKYAKHTLYKIKALIDFSDVKAGDLGGYIESENNLSQHGNAWVYDNAKVLCDAFVGGNATVKDFARVYNKAQIEGNAKVCGDARVGCNAKVCGDATIKAWIGGNAVIGGNTVIENNAQVNGNARIECNGHISSNQDYIIIEKLGACNDAITFYKDSEVDIAVNFGCSSFSIKEFEEQVLLQEKCKFAKEYKLAIQLAKLHILGEENV